MLIELVKLLLFIQLTKRLIIIKVIFSWKSLNAVWKKCQGSSDNEYTKTSSFVFKGKINDLTSYRDSGDDDDEDDED